ncbi:MAG: GDP-mannose 4,6-dehydratase, partial [Lachnospiraceae bacterium]|nr:GDP-mannose 4,6-dehydratase [Lachnospiraceae bacterium]
QDEPDDYVVATGVTRTVRDFVKIAFEKVGIEIEFSGEGVNEVGKDKATGKVLVQVNPKFFRPAEVDLLIGSPKKAEEKLGWTREISFEEMVDRMIANDLAITQLEIDYKKIKESK